MQVHRKGDRLTSRVRGAADPLIQPMRTGNQQSAGGHSPRRFVVAYQDAGGAQEEHDETLPLPVLTDVAVRQARGAQSNGERQHQNLQAFVSEPAEAEHSCGRNP